MRALVTIARRDTGYKPIPYVYGVHVTVDGKDQTIGTYGEFEHVNMVAYGIAVAYRLAGIETPLIEREWSE